MGKPITYLSVLREGGRGWVRHFQKKARAGLELCAIFGLGALFHLWISEWEDVKEEILIWVAYALLPVIAWLALVLTWNVWLAPLKFLRNAEDRAEGFASVVQHQGDKWSRDQEWSGAARYLRYHKTQLEELGRLIGFMIEQDEVEEAASLVLRSVNLLVEALGFMCPDAMAIFGHIEDVEVLAPILQPREILGRLDAAKNACDEVARIASTKLAADTQHSQKPAANSSHP